MCFDCSRARQGRDLEKQGHKKSRLRRKRTDKTDTGQAIGQLDSMADSSKTQATSGDAVVAVGSAGGAPFEAAGSDTDIGTGSRTQEEKEIIQQLSLKLLQQTEVTNSLQQRIAESNRQLSQQKQLLLQARKEKHDADLEVTRLSTEVESITQELFEQANSQVREANVGAYNIRQMNERLSNTIKEKDTTIEILQSELTKLKNVISEMEAGSQSAEDLVSRTQGNDLPALSAQQTAQEDSKLPTCAAFASKALSQLNQKQIYTPIYNQLRFDLPAYTLFSESLLPHASLASSSAASELAAHLHRPSVSASSSSSSVATFDIKTTKFFLKLIDELDEDLRLEKAPSLQTFKLRWNRKTFLLELIDKLVTIEPLSAATEVWKRQTLQKYVPVTTPSTPKIPLPDSTSSDSSLPVLSRHATSATPTTSSYDPTLFKLASNAATPASKPEGVAPLALVAPCGLCGEKRRDMNFSRLYHIRISSPSSSSTTSTTTSTTTVQNSSLSDSPTKADYPLCINCANKYRAVVELLKFVSAIHPSNVKEGEEFDDYLRTTWAKIVELKARVWFAVNIGIWSDKETYGLVYGWQNDWFTDHVIPESKVVKNRENEDSPREQEAKTSTIDNNNDATTPDANSVAKGWNGWSGVIAKPVGHKNVDVGVGVGVDSGSGPNADASRTRNFSNVTDRDVSPVTTETEVEAKDTDEDELTFQDASDGRKTPAAAAVAATTVLCKPVVAPEKDAHNPQETE